MQNNTARSNSRPLANGGPRNNRHANAQERAVANVHVAAGMATRGHVRKSPHDVMVVYTRRMVDDAVTTNDSLWANDGASQDHGARQNFGIRTHGRARMDDGCITLSRKP